MTRGGREWQVSNERDLEESGKALGADHSVHVAWREEGLKHSHGWTVKAEVRRDKERLVWERGVYGSWLFY